MTSVQKGELIQLQNRVLGLVASVGANILVELGMDNVKAGKLVGELVANQLSQVV